MTPTAEDFSGTMDKTVSEIRSAYLKRQKIVFKVMISATEHMDVDVTATWNTSASYPSFNAFIVDDSRDLIICATTGATNDGNKNTYSTSLYTLTPVTITEPDVNE